MFGEREWRASAAKKWIANARRATTIMTPID